jgi:hypothetical protein
MTPKDGVNALLYKQDFAPTFISSAFLPISSQCVPYILATPKYYLQIPKLPSSPILLCPLHLLFLQSKFTHLNHNFVAWET